MDNQSETQVRFAGRSNESRPVVPAPKKEYAAPQVTDYGDIRDLTQASTLGSLPDDFTAFRS